MDSWQGVATTLSSSPQKVYNTRLPFPSKSLISHRSLSLLPEVAHSRVSFPLVLDSRAVGPLTPQRVFHAHVKLDHLQTVRGTTTSSVAEALPSQVPEYTILYKRKYNVLKIIFHGNLNSNAIPQVGYDARDLPGASKFHIRERLLRAFSYPLLVCCAMENSGINVDRGPYATFQYLNRYTY